MRIWQKLFAENAIAFADQNCNNFFRDLELDRSKTEFNQSTFNTVASAVGAGIATLTTHNRAIFNFPLATAPPAAGKAAGDAYRKKEKELDALVPELFKNMQFGKFAQPENAKAWQQQRPATLNRVFAAAVRRLASRLTAWGSRVSRQCLATS